MPNVIKLSDSELLCFYLLGQAFYSVDGKIALLRSHDGGRNWQQSGFVWDDLDEPIPFSYSAPHAVRCRDGTLVLTITRHDASDPDKMFFNGDTGGCQAYDILLLTSQDDGATWSAPAILDLPGERVVDIPSQIIELNDGRWFLPCEQWKSWDDAGPLHIKGFGLFSDDKGKSWSERVDFPSANHDTLMFSHSRYTQMRDGRICALQWTQQLGTSADCDLHFVVSDETGRHWSSPAPTGIRGQTSWVADLGQDVLVAAYSAREREMPGIKVVASFDGGKQWNLDDPLVVWDAVGQEFLGVTHKPDYPASHDNIAFGKPNVLRLTDDSVICSWWCTQASVTHSRFAIVHLV